MSSGTRPPNLRVQDTAAGPCCAACRQWSNTGGDLGFCFRPRGTKRAPLVAFYKVCDDFSERPASHPECPLNIDDKAECPCSLDCCPPPTGFEADPEPAPALPVVPAPDQGASGGAGAEPPSVSRLEDDEADHYLSVRR
jgi:hypothetical protein